MWCNVLICCGIWRYVPYVALRGVMWRYVALDGVMWRYVALYGVMLRHVRLCGVI